MTGRAPTVLVFVDGLGLGTADGSLNPLHSGACPCLESFIEQHAVPIDACLGVPGLPQSATGQTALLTGINAPRIVGRHVEGFPTKRLAEIVRRHNIFSRFLDVGLRCTFANAYYVRDLSEVLQRPWQSVTTVATLHAFGGVRDRAMLERNEAVYQDLTRASLRQRGYKGPLVSPVEAAGHLLALACRHDLTLFEYFQTDRAGHRADMKAARDVLAVLDAFLEALLAGAGETLHVVLTSDHGNIEDPSGHAHTANPVPFAVRGPDEEACRRSVKSLVDVTPALLDMAVKDPC